MKHTWLILLAFVSAADAQTVSDTELQAGYCLGVTTAQIADNTAKYSAADNAVSRSEYADITKLIQERQKRFRDYLVAKGFTQERSAAYLKTALERGEADVASCETELERPYYKECSDRCYANV